MHDDLRKFFITGEFAKLCNIKKLHYVLPKYKKRMGIDIIPLISWSLFKLSICLKRLVTIKRNQIPLKRQNSGRIVPLLKEKPVEAFTVIEGLVNE